MLCLLLAATAGCDRVTKHLAVTTLAGMPEQSYLGDTVRLDYHENAGGFLSAGATWRPAVADGRLSGRERRFPARHAVAGDPLSNGRGWRASGW